MRIYEGFGQSESSVLLANYPWVEIKPGSMGKPAPGYDIALLDENGEPIYLYCASGDGDYPYAFKGRTYVVGIKLDKKQ